MTLLHTNHFHSITPVDNKDEGVCKAPVSLQPLLIYVLVYVSQEKRIYDLKKKNQELEKFKFVLDYKIKELKKQIEPRENDIKAMKEQIQEVSSSESQYAWRPDGITGLIYNCIFSHASVQMEGELESFHKQNTRLELNIAELRLKLRATDREMHKEMQKVCLMGVVRT